jgi:hypothetical protein
MERGERASRPEEQPAGRRSRVRRLARSLLGPSVRLAAPATRENAYAQAMRLTGELLQRRGAQYRNLVVLVVLCLLGGGGAALAARSLAPLLGWLLVPPLCALFIGFDTFSVRRWQAGLLELSRQGLLDLTLFRRMITGVQTLPRESLSALLELLPAPPPGRETSPQGGWRPTEKEHGLLLRVIRAYPWSHTVSALRATLGISLGLGAVAAAVARRSPTPLLLLLLYLPLHLAAHGYHLRLRSSLSQQLRALGLPHEQQEHHVRWIATLLWGGETARGGSHDEGAPPDHHAGKGAPAEK